MVSCQLVDCAYIKTAFCRFTPTAPKTVIPFSLSLFKDILTGRSEVLHVLLFRNKTLKEDSSK